MQPLYHSEFVRVDPNSGYSEPIGFENVGKTPASNVHIDVVLELLFRGDALEFNYKNMARNLNVGLLFPNSPREIPVPASEIGPDGKARTATVTQKFFDSFEHGEGYTVMYGKISYHDKTGAHWTTFCSFRSTSNVFSRKEGSPEGMAGRCTAYNQAD
jgi:hypothetical protein